MGVCVHRHRPSGGRSGTAPLLLSSIVHISSTEFLLQGKWVEVCTRHCSEVVRSCYWLFLVTRRLYGTAETIKINNKKSIQICSSVLAFHLLIAVLASLDSKYFLFLFLILHIYQFQSQQLVTLLTSVASFAKHLEAAFLFALTAETHRRT